MLKYVSLKWRLNNITKREIELILNQIVVIYDTREREYNSFDSFGNKIVCKKNQHILDYLEKNNIPYEREKLDCGDYSYKIPGREDISKLIAIERKNSLDEISSNFGKNRDRFSREFERFKINGIQPYLIIENASWTKVFNASYRGGLHKNAMISSIIAWEQKYNCPVHLIKKSESGELIYNLILWNLKKKLDCL